MSLFEHLAAYYDDLFPVNPTALAFLKTLFRERKACTVLDIACGTGRYTLALAGLGFAAAGLDLDAAMIARAIETRREEGMESVPFVVGDMRCIASRFERQDALICIGNSLANLTNLADIRRAVQQFFAVLHPGGTAVIQLVNFDRHIRQGLEFKDIVRASPPVRFQRRYAARPDGLIDFHTLLEFPCPNDTEATCTETDSTPLYPLTGEVMSGLLAESGFIDIMLLGSFARESFSLDSPASIYVAYKPRV